MAILLKDQSKEGKIKFLMEAMDVDRGRAEIVVANGSLFADYVANFERGLMRYSQDPEKSVGGYLNAIASTRSDMTEERKRADWQHILSRSMSGAGIKKELTDAHNYLKKISKYVTPDTIDRFNGLLKSVQKIDPSIKFDFVEGGAGAGGVDLRAEATAPGQGSASKNMPNSGTAGSNTSTTNTADGSITGSGPDGTNPKTSSPPKQSDYANYKDYIVAVQQYVRDRRATGTTGSGPDGTGSTGSGSGGMSGVNRAAQIQSAIDFINAQDIPADLKALYITTVQNWDPNLELNADNIIATFDKIRKETIDPRFQGLTNLAIESVKTAKKAYEDQRAVELESEALNRSEDIRGTQAGLEASGLTFSGEGLRQLGTGLAATSFGGQIEGLVPKKHKLISTSSEAAYQQNLKNLGLSAEEQLGSAGVSGLVPGYAPVGSVVGSLPEAKQSAQGSVLSDILNQQITNKAQNENIDYSQSSYA